MMGQSLAILGYAPGDFAKVVARFRLTVGEEFDPARDNPPVALARRDDADLVFVDLRGIDSLLDLSEMSRDAACWCFQVWDTVGMTLLSRHEHGQTLCEIVAGSPEGEPLTVEGECPFDVQAVIEQVTDEAEHDREMFGPDEGEIDWYRVPVHLFEGLYGFHFRGPWPSPIHRVTGSLPVKVW